MKWLVSMYFDNGVASSEQFDDLEEAAAFYSMVSHWNDVIKATIEEVEE